MKELHPAISRRGCENAPYWRLQGVRLTYNSRADGAQKVDPRPEATLPILDVDTVEPVIPSICVLSVVTAGRVGGLILVVTGSG